MWENGSEARASGLILTGEIDENPGGRESVFAPFRSMRRLPGYRAFRTEALREMPRVVVCDEQLPDGTWKDVLDFSQRLPIPAPVVVTSRIADEHLWAEVLNLGGYDLLAKPLVAAEVHRVLYLAWQHWRNRLRARTAAMHLGLMKRSGAAELSVAPVSASSRVTESKP